MPVDQGDTYACVTTGCGAGACVGASNKSSKSAVADAGAGAGADTTSDAAGVLAVGPVGRLLNAVKSHVHQKNNSRPIQARQAYFGDENDGGGLSFGIGLSLPVAGALDIMIVLPPELGCATAEIGGSVRDERRGGGTG